MRRLPAPWSVRPLAGAYVVMAADETPVAYVYFRAVGGANNHAFSREEALIVANSLARHPELVTSQLSGSARKLEC